MEPSSCALATHATVERGWDVHSVEWKKIHQRLGATTQQHSEHHLQKDIVGKTHITCRKNE